MTTLVTCQLKHKHPSLPPTSPFFSPPDPPLPRPPLFLLERTTPTVCSISLTAAAHTFGRITSPRGFRPPPHLATFVSTLGLVGVRRIFLLIFLIYVHSIAPSNVPLTDSPPPNRSSHFPPKSDSPSSGLFDLTTRSSVSQDSFLQFLHRSNALRSRSVDPFRPCHPTPQPGCPHRWFAPPLDLFYQPHPTAPLTFSDPHRSALRCDELPSIRFSP